MFRRLTTAIAHVRGRLLSRMRRSPYSEPICRRYGWLVLAKFRDEFRTVMTRNEREEREERPFSILRAPCEEVICDAAAGVENKTLRRHEVQDPPRLGAWFRCEPPKQGARFFRSRRPESNHPRPIDPGRREKPSEPACHLSGDNLANPAIKHGDTCNVHRDGNSLKSTIRIDASLPAPSGGFR